MPPINTVAMRGGLNNVRVRFGEAIQFVKRNDKISGYSSGFLPDDVISTDYSR